MDRVEDGWQGMKILYHHRTQAEDAQGIHIYEMVKAFRDLGHEVEMVALVEVDMDNEKKNPRWLWKVIGRWVSNWLYELMGLAYNLYGYLRLSRVIRLKGPDLIYERYSLNTVCGIWASRRFGIPLVLEVNAPLYHEQKQLGKLAFKRLAKFSERWICSHSTWTVVVSKTMKAVLMQEGVPDKNIVVVPNGIDPQKFHPSISGRAIRERYALEGKLVIGFVGWFRPWHGLDMLLEIFRDVHMAEKNLRLLLVGDGPAYADLYRYADTHDLLSAVIFTGAVRSQETAAHIAAMDITVQPSATEYACPMKIFEYMAMGKCIIAPDQSNMRDLLENQVNGYLFTPGNREHFKTVLQHAIQYPASRQLVQKNAYEAIFQQEFLWSANAKKILGLVFGNSDRLRVDLTSDIPQPSCEEFYQ